MIKRNPKRSVGMFQIDAHGTSCLRGINEIQEIEAWCNAQQAGVASRILLHMFSCHLLESYNLIDPQWQQLQGKPSLQTATITSETSTSFVLG